MVLKFGDVVTLVKKSPDGELRRVNAIVLRTAVHTPLTIDGKQKKDDAGNPLPPEEYVDLAYPVLEFAPEGFTLKTNNFDEIFRRTYSVGYFVEGASIGYEIPGNISNNLQADKSDTSELGSVEKSAAEDLKGEGHE